MERQEDYMASLLQHSILINILKHLLLPSYICLTDNWWSCLILAMDIEELYFKWTYKYIRWWYWWNISTVIIDPEVKHYSYCSWRQRLMFSYCCRDEEVRYCSWVRDSRQIDSRVSNYCSVSGSQRLLIRSWSWAGLQNFWYGSVAAPRSNSLTIDIS